MIGENTPKSPRVRNDKPGWEAKDQGQLVAAVVARVSGDVIGPASLQVITPQVLDGVVRWRVPEGHWRIFAYHLQYTGQQNSARNYIPNNWVIGHCNQDAIQAYSNHLNRAFSRGFGGHMGKTVDSYFAGCRENVPIYNTLLRSNTLLDDFRAYRGYDLTPYLPVLWCDAGQLTPRIRYDLSSYIAQCCWMMRPGRFVGGVLLYSPRDTFWTGKTVFWIDRRVMNYGDIPHVLDANGYDYL